MRPLLRTSALAVLTALVAAVVLFRPGAAAPVAAAQPAAGELPTDLALVPADAAGFIHVRVADLWKNDAFAPFRKTFEKAGPKVLAALDGQFVPKFSTFDRATVFLLMAGEDREPVPVFVLRFNAPFDQDEVLKAYVPDAKKVTVNGKTAYGSRESGVAMYFPDKQHIVFGPARGFEVYLKHESPKTGPMSSGLKLAATGRPVVGSVSFTSFPIPPQFLANLPPEVKPLLKADHLTASLDLGATAKIEVTAGYKNADDAKDAEKAIKTLAEWARKELGTAREDIEKRFLAQKGPRPAGDLPEALLMVFALGAINHIDDLLAKPEEFVKRTGSDLTATVPLPKELVAIGGELVAVGVGLLLPAVQKVREAAARMQSANNLKQIGIAIHNYESVYGHLPHDIVDKNGKPILSWRVAILPYIEQNNLYKLFKLDEPWDSPNNRAASGAVIKTYTSPLVNTPPGKTNYRAFAGPGTIFEPGKKVKIADITDGTSNTIMVAEVADPVDWAKPDDVPFDPKKPLPKLVRPGSDIMQVLMGDGSVRAVNMKTITEKTLKNAIIRNDGNPLGDDW